MAYRETTCRGERFYVDDDIAGTRRRCYHSPERRREDSPERWDASRRHDDFSPRERYRDDSSRDHSRSERQYGRRHSPECTHRVRGDEYDRGFDEPASNTLLVKGIPDRWTDADISDVCYGYTSDIKDIRRVARRGRGDENLEFHSVELAESAFDGWLYDALDRAGLYRVHLDFAQPLAAKTKGALDWNCQVCDLRNFARREACVRCRVTRDCIGGRYSAGTRSICIRHLPERFTEEDIRILVADYGAVCELQLPQTREGELLGAAFVTFQHLKESQRALEGLHGVEFGNGDDSKRLSVCYAAEHACCRPRGRDSDRSRDNVANDAIAAATAMNSYHAPSSTGEASDNADSWKPRSFTIAALNEDDGAKGASAKDQSVSDGGAKSAEGGFVYDEASGYYYDAASGYFYDAATQLYYHSSTQSWYRHNAETGGYDVIPASESKEESGGGSHTQPASGHVAASVPTQNTLSVPQKEISIVGGSVPSAVAAQKSAAPKKALVSDFLKRKAEEQRQAARDFLKTDTAPVSQTSSPEPPAKLQCVRAPVTTTVPCGIVRQKVYQSQQTTEPSSVGVGSTVPTEGTVVQAVQGGVIRGKSYRRAA